MRRYVKLLEERGLLRRLDAPLRARRGDTELQALMTLLQRTDGPGLMLNGVEGLNTQGLPVLFNPFGSHERTALMLGAETWNEARERYVRVAADPSTWHAPVVVPRAGAPCQEEVIRDVDLRRDLPHLWFGKEGASFVTGAVVITRDPETGQRNVGWYRLTSFVDASHPRGGTYREELAKKFLAGFFWWNPPMNGIGRHIADAVRRGRRLEVACAVNPNRSTSPMTVHAATSSASAITSPPCITPGGPCMSSRGVNVVCTDDASPSTCFSQRRWRPIGCDGLHPKHGEPSPK
jgi:4-hydroxy-3-polyprenylbenzoate decarboxylase